MSKHQEVRETLLLIALYILGLSMLFVVSALVYVVYVGFGIFPSVFLGFLFLSALIVVVGVEGRL